MILIDKKQTLFNNLLAELLYDKDKQIHSFDRAFVHPLLIIYDSLLTLFNHLKS